MVWVEAAAGVAGEAAGAGERREPEREQEWRREQQKQQKLGQEDPARWSRSSLEGVVPRARARLPRLSTTTVRLVWLAESLATSLGSQSTPSAPSTEPQPAFFRPSSNRANKCTLKQNSSNQRFMPDVNTPVHSPRTGVSTVPSVWGLDVEEVVVLKVRIGRRCVHQFQYVFTYLLFHRTTAGGWPSR